MTMLAQSPNRLVIDVKINHKGKYSKLTSRVGAPSLLESFRGVEGPASALLELLDPSVAGIGGGSVLASACWGFEGLAALGGSVRGRFRASPIPPLFKTFNSGVLLDVLVVVVVCLMSQAFPSRPLTGGTAIRL